MSVPKLNVAVIIPTYNRAHFLREAIESALSQRMPPTGVYVVDDASTDETPQLMETWYAGHPRVHYIRLPENSGPAYARMVGVKAAQTEWVAFLDSDDVWLPDHLEKAAQIIAENPHVRFIYAQRCHINKDSKLIIDHITETWSGRVLEVLLKRIIFRPSQIITHVEVYYKTASMIPLTIKEVYFVEDYITGILMAHLFGDKIYISPYRTVLMRTHENQSYHLADRLRKNLLKAVDIVFDAAKGLETYKSLTKAANLYHAPYFMWRAGEWTKAWKIFLEGILSELKSIGLKDFWVTGSRLVWPPKARALLRPGR